jgi:hypothetical protein
MLHVAIALMKTLMQKKMGLDLHIDVPNLVKKDNALVVFLSELNKDYYSLDPVACDRIAKYAEDLVTIRLEQETCRLPRYKEDALELYSSYQIHMKRILELKKNLSKNTSTNLTKIDLHFKSHLESIMAR